MTPEERQLLIKDLCARLPYRVKGLHRGQVHIIANMDGGSLYPSIQVNGYCAWFPVETFKPYLRPMSSMTDSEKEELKQYLDAKELDCNGFGYIEGGTLENYVSNVPYSICSYVIDWLNAHHFDYRGLIEKGLALEVTKENNPYKQ